MKRNIPISLPVLGEDEWNAVREPLFSGWVTQGPKVKEFERLFAEKHKVKHALAVSNCTTALHLALVALDIKAGDEVLVPAFTWIATANAVVYCGATPIFVDIDAATFNIDVEKIRQKITTKTKAIIPVHLFGLCADVDRIRAEFPDLKIVEDAACAAGAALNGTPAGGLGDIGCFSFHPRKSITTGEGGMLTTNDDALAATLDKLRNHGASISEEQRHMGARPFILPDFDVVGYNYRMTDIQGAVGVVQMGRLEGFIAERSKWAAFYNEQFAAVDWLRTPEYDSRYTHGWQSYVLFINEAKASIKRNELMEFLQQKGISTRPGTHAVHMQGYYVRTYHIHPYDYPVAWAANEYSMSIPLHNRMSEEDFHYVVETIMSI